MERQRKRVHTSLLKCLRKREYMGDDVSDGPTTERSDLVQTGMYMAKKTTKYPGKKLKNKLLKYAV